MTSANAFFELPLDSEDVDTSKKVVASKKATAPKVVIPDIQNLFSLIVILWSGLTENEFIICKTKISSIFKLKKNATLFDLDEKINRMDDLPYSCLVWSTTIDTPELKKMIENQYTLPVEYRYLRSLLCDTTTIKNTEKQNVLILDFRRRHLKGCEYVYLKNHKQLFFGYTRESYLERKSKVNGLKKYFFNFYRRFNFSEAEKIASECHKFALTTFDKSQIEFCENRFHLLKEAKSVFELYDAKILRRFPSFEALKTEIDMVLLHKKELIEMLPELKLKYDRMMIVQEVSDPEAFPSL